MSENSKIEWTDRRRRSVRTVSGPIPGNSSRADQDARSCYVEEGAMFGDGVQKRCLVHRVFGHGS